jgi:hypothetical protein
MFPSGTGYKNIILRKSSKKKKISEYVIDETVIKVGSEYIGYGLLLSNLKAKKSSE